MGKKRHYPSVYSSGKKVLLVQGESTSAQGKSYRGIQSRQDNETVPYQNDELFKRGAV